MELALEAGAEDVVGNDDGSVDVMAAWEDFNSVKDALVAGGQEPAAADVTMMPATTVPLDKDGAEKIMRLVDLLEDLDDVQNVFSNADIPDEVLAELE